MIKSIPLTVVSTAIFMSMVLHVESYAQSSKIYVFDGFKLGDNYSNVMQRSPYNQPCDDDPIDNQNRRFMVYGALPCRDNSFPNETTVMFYLKYSDEDSYNQPIEAFGYLYGSYFNDKTNFPLKPGDDLTVAQKEFGKEINTFNISRKEHTLKVHLFEGEIYVICDQNKIVGFVLGKMPSDSINEQWRGLMQMYQRYTPKE